MSDSKKNGDGSGDSRDIDDKDDRGHDGVQKMSIGEGQALTQLDSNNGKRSVALGACNAAAGPGESCSDDRSSHNDQVVKQSNISEIQETAKVQSVSSSNENGGTKTEKSAGGLEPGEESSNVELPQGVREAIRYWLVGNCEALSDIRNSIKGWQSFVPKNDAELAMVGKVLSADDATIMEFEYKVYSNKQTIAEFLKRWKSPTHEEPANKNYVLGEVFRRIHKLQKIEQTMEESLKSYLLFNLEEENVVRKLTEVFRTHSRDAFCSEFEEMILLSNSSVENVPAVVSARNTPVNSRSGKMIASWGFAAEDTEGVRDVTAVKIASAIFTKEDPDAESKKKNNKGNKGNAGKKGKGTQKVSQNQKAFNDEVAEVIRRFKAVATDDNKMNEPEEQAGGEKKSLTSKTPGSSSEGETPDTNPVDEKTFQNAPRSAPKQEEGASSTTAVPQPKVTDNGQRSSSLKFPDNLQEAVSEWFLENEGGLTRSPKKVWKTSPFLSLQNVIMEITDWQDSDWNELRDNRINIYFNSIRAFEDQYEYFENNSPWLKLKQLQKIASMYLEERIATFERTKVNVESLVYESDIFHEQLKAVWGVTIMPDEVETCKRLISMDMDHRLSVFRPLKSNLQNLPRDTVLKLCYVKSCINVGNAWLMETGFMKQQMMEKLKNQWHADQLKSTDKPPASQ